jgi:hypothetical protein
MMTTVASICQSIPREASNFHCKTVHTTHNENNYYEFRKSLNFYRGVVADHRPLRVKGLSHVKEMSI